MTHGHAGVVSLSPFPSHMHKCQHLTPPPGLVEVSNLSMGIGNGLSFMSGIGLYSLPMCLGKIPPLGCKRTTLP